MRLFAVNANNDIFATPGGRLAISEGLQAVLQNCEHAVQAQAMEMIYAVDRGVNSFDSIWNGSPNVLQFEAFARRQLRRVQNVISVDGFDASVRNNTLSYQATIRTTFGTGEVSGQL